MDQLLEKLHKPPPKVVKTKVEYTPWFQGKDNPTRIGWYETRSLYHPNVLSYPDYIAKSNFRCRMLWWNGYYWLTGPHGLLTRFGSSQQETWRGLVK